ncbi:Phosphoenolpyruvate/pyruvate domain-containing protein [Aspergillus keveii]|uniref:Phosphoenolpyruvate/pyruvate domain-containing protein n=1 Tax=Aspergillus keveii TaxID=714993 RepID=A0ABR4FLF0_9EURO
MSTDTNALAQTFKSLHKPRTPLLLTNVYDGITAKTIAALPNSRALATASHAIAEAAGIDDDDLTLPQNLRATRLIASAIKPFSKPLTVDLQDGYGAHLEHAIGELISFGVVGINLEDFNRQTNDFFPLPEAAERVHRVLSTAKEKGVPDFVVNARCDILAHGGTIEEVIERGKAYLDAGATTVFIWGGSARGGLKREEVVQLVAAFDGRLSVLLKLKDGLSVKELGEIGVARISLGPTLQRIALERIREVASEVYGE